MIPKSRTLFINKQLMVSVTAQDKGGRFNGGYIQG